MNIITFSSTENYNVQRLSSCLRYEVTLNFKMVVTSSTISRQILMSVPRKRERVLKMRTVPTLRVLLRAPVDRDSLGME